MKIWMSSPPRCVNGRLSPAQRRDCRLVVRAVAAATGVRYCEFFARSRLRLQKAYARQLAMYLCHTLLGLTMTQVGQFFGRDRTTVAYACAQIEDTRDEGGPADLRIQAIEEEVARDRDQLPVTMAPSGMEEAHA